MQVNFTCPGSCGGRVTQDEHDDGKTHCAAVDCELHGEELEKIYHCESCDVDFRPGEEHLCE